MNVDLIIRRKSDLQSYKITCDLAERVTFGRSITSPAHFEGSEVSREHFALFMREGSPFVEDLSANGTRVNGKSAPPAKPRKLSAGDIIEVPGYEIELESGTNGYAPREQVSATPEEKKSSRELIGTFTLWELTIVAAAVATGALILYYWLV